MEVLVAPVALGDGILQRTLGTDHSHLRLGDITTTITMPTTAPILSVVLVVVVVTADPETVVVWVAAMQTPRMIMLFLDSDLQLQSHRHPRELAVEVVILRTTITVMTVMDEVAVEMIGLVGTVT